MFAVVRCGGKQYKVAQDSVIVVEKLEAQVGDVVRFDQVLAIGGGSANDSVVPVGGAYVEAEVLRQKRQPTVLVFKKKRRKNYRRKNGHRQYVTCVKVTAINVG